MSGIARCTLIGVVAKHGTEVRYTSTGTPCASLTVVVSELGQDGKTHDLYVLVEIWGRKAEQAGEIEPGQWVLFEGKLARRRRGETWEWLVAGFELMALAPPMASMTDGSL
jgi:single-stranded DNA-binding protein